MKFAHIRVSEYFTFAKQIFHSVSISLARRANFTKKAIRLRGWLFYGRGGQFRTPEALFWKPIRGLKF